jgi:hypothetical protein
LSLRILVAGQPKTGNVWIRKILSELYALHDLNELPGQIPDTAPQLAKFVEEGRFLGNAIFQQHFWPNAQLLNICRNLDCSIVTILRNPYDAFVSFYHFVNNEPERFRDSPSGVLIDKPLEHPDVVDFIATPYRRHLRLSIVWMRSGRALLLRYEELKANPMASVRYLANTLPARNDDEIQAALKRCTPESLRAKGSWLARHVRSASVGEGRSMLGPANKRAFRDHHGALIRALGYEVL